MIGAAAVVILGSSGAGVAAAGLGVALGRRSRRIDPVGAPCRTCDGARAPWTDLVPVMAPARCAACGRTVRGPIVALEVASGVVAGALAARGEASWVLVGRWWAVVWVVGLVWSDARHRVLPAELVGRGLVGSVACLAAAAAAPGGDGAALVRAVAVSGVAWTGMALLHRRSPSSLGWGDVRMCSLLALHLGWSSVAAAWWALLVAAGLGHAWGRLAPGGRRATVPFGPFLALGTAVALVAAAPG